MSIKEKLTKEEVIRRHRLMWNYIADESARARTRISKGDALIHFGWKETPFNYCWCCEYADRKASKYCYYKNMCDYCPLDLRKGNSNGVIYCSTKYMNIYGVFQEGLYTKWNSIRLLDSCDSEKLDEYIDLAKRIANLPEKED